MAKFQAVRVGCQNIKESFTQNRPHIAESFINQLMSTHLEDATSITFGIDHLTACVNQLASDIMSREKLVFEKYDVSEFCMIYLLRRIELYVFQHF